jgi:hypothetical protein
LLPYITLNTFPENTSIWIFPFNAIEKGSTVKMMTRTSQKSETGASGKIFVNESILFLKLEITCFL